ncbi:MAG: hypothetical protein ACOZNI_24045 [Myxococcota bacterium]
MIALLAGCAGEPDTESRHVGDDSGEPADTDDSGEPADTDDSGEPADTDDTAIPALPEVPACEGLEDPWVADAFEDVLPTIWYGTPDVVDIWHVRGAATYSAELTGCPRLSEDGGVTVMQDDCELEDFAFSGRWAFDDGTDTLEVVAIAAEGRTLTGDGWLAYDASTDTLTADLAYAQTGTTSFDGTFEYRDYTATYADGFSSIDGRLALDVPEGAGDLCIWLDERPTTCEIEPQQVLALTGTSAWVLVYDGETHCDGCGGLYRDGELYDWGCDG